MNIKTVSFNLSLLLLSLTVTGCQSIFIPNGQATYSTDSIQQQITVARGTLESKTATDKLRNLKYTPIENGGSFVQIDENSQVYSFESGKSYVAAYSIDRNNVGKTISLNSPLDFSVFIPSAIILDEQFNIINAINSRNFPYTKNAFGTNLYSGTISLPEGYSKLYLLIYTTTEDSSKSTAIDKDLLQNSMRYDRASDVGKYSRLSIPHSTIGRIKMDIISNDNDDYFSYQRPSKTPICQLNSPKTDANISEQDYYMNIRKSLSINDYKQAITYVRQAECAGYTKARDVFFQ